MPPCWMHNCLNRSIVKLSERHTCDCFVHEFAAQKRERYLSCPDDQLTWCWVVCLHISDILKDAYKSVVLSVRYEICSFGLSIMPSFHYEYLLVMHLCPTLNYCQRLWACGCYMFCTLGGSLTLLTATILPALSMLATANRGSSG